MSTGSWGTSREQIAVASTLFGSTYSLIFDSVDFLLFFFLFFFCCAFNIPWSVGFFSFYLFSPWKDFMGSVAVREVVLWRVCDHVYFLRSLWSLQKHPGFHPLFNTASSRSLKLLSKCSGDHMIIFITSHIVISAINLWYKEQSCERGI